MAGVNTGASVMGLAFDGGVIIAADTLVSYGNMTRFTECDRLYVVNKYTVVGASGDYPDYQFLTKIIRQKQLDERQWNDGLDLYPAALHSWITRVAYNRRSKFEPLWNSWVVAGLQPNEDTGKLEPFLGFVDKLGLAYKSNIVTTAMSDYLAKPIIRELTENMDRLPTEAEARTLITRSMELLYYRDCRSWPKYKQIIIKPEGVNQEGPLEVKGDWSVAHECHGY